jgi:hypothetical protein
MTQSGLAPSGRLVLPGPVLDLVAASVTADNSRRLFDAPNAVIRAHYRLNFGFRRRSFLIDIKFEAAGQLYFEAYRP